MVMQFGQFLDHDLTLTPEKDVTGCCTEEALNGVFAPDCFPILFEDSDPTFANLGKKFCLLYMYSKTESGKKTDMLNI